MKVFAPAAGDSARWGCCQPALTSTCCTVVKLFAPAGDSAGVDIARGQRAELGGWVPRVNHHTLPAPTHPPPTSLTLSTCWSHFPLAGHTFHLLVTHWAPLRRRCGSTVCARRMSSCDLQRLGASGTARYLRHFGWASMASQHCVAALGTAGDAAAVGGPTPIQPRLCTACEACRPCAQQQ